METQIAVKFLGQTIPETGTIVLLAASKKKWGASLKKLDKQSGGHIGNAMSISSFEGGKSETIEIVSPANLKLSRLIILGLGDDTIDETSDWMKVGGRICGLVKGDPTGVVTVLVEDIGKDFAFSANDIAAIATGF